MVDSEMWLLVGAREAMLLLFAARVFAVRDSVRGEAREARVSWSRGDNDDGSTASCSSGRRTAARAAAAACTGRAPSVTRQQAVGAAKFG